jgi:hypothetical protein
MSQNPGIKIEIGSHTDNFGNAAYNLKLSQARAESVVKFLIDKGIDPTRMIAKGYGATKPLVNEKKFDSASKKWVDCPECRQINRRTEFRIIGNIPHTTIQYHMGDAGYDAKKDEKVDNGEDVKGFQIDKDKEEKEDKAADNPDNTKDQQKAKPKDKSNKPK